MAQQNIDFGAYPNDPDSDAIRVAFQKSQDNFTELFEATILAAGVSNIYAGAGLNVNRPFGNVTISANIPNITIQTGDSLLVGVSTATTNTATITSGTTPFVITLANTITTGNIIATGNLQGTLNVLSSSQPNITSLGTLTGLTSTGNITAPFFIGNIVATNIQGTIQASGTNTQVQFNNQGSIAASANLTFTGTALSVIGNVNASNANLGNTVTANFFVGNINGIFANGNSNIAIPNAGGNINFSSAGNANVLIVTGTGANIFGTLNAGNANVANLGTPGIISAQGNIIGGNVRTAGLISATGNGTFGNIQTAGVLSATSNITGGNLVTSGILSVGSSASITGNITSNGNFSTSGNISANGFISATSNVTGGNILTDGIISSTGTLTSGNVLTSGIVSATGNLTGANIRSNGILSATGNLTVANASLGNIAVANFFSGDGGLLTNLVIGTVTFIANGISNVRVFQDGNVTSSISGSPNVFITTSTGIISSGTVNDSKGDLRNIPQNAQSATYTLQASDAGKHISSSAGDINIPANVFTVGQVVSIFNNSTSSKTIIPAAGVTLYFAGIGVVGNRTFAQRGLATIMCVGANIFTIIGAGLS